MSNVNQSKLKVEFLTPERIWLEALISALNEIAPADAHRAVDIANIATSAFMERFPDSAELPKFEGTKVIRLRTFVTITIKDKTFNLFDFYVPDEPQNERLFEVVFGEAGKTNYPHNAMFVREEKPDAL